MAGLRSTFLVLTLVVFTLVSAACAAVPPQVPVDDVWALSQPSTLNNAYSVLTGTASFGKIMVKDGMYTVMWPIKNMGWASLFIDAKTLCVLTDKNAILRAIGQAGIFNSETFGDFTLALKSNGFVEVTASQVPAFLASTLSSVKSVPILVLPYGLYKSGDDLMPQETQQ